MKKYVFDSFAMFAYFEKENNFDVVSDILIRAIDNEAEIFMSVVNWGEVYYIALREGGKERAELYRSIISQYPITIVEANKELTLSAAVYKAFNKISYADAFAASLSEQRKAILVTGDKELKSLEKKIKIHWI